MVYGIGFEELTCISRFCIYSLASYKPLEKKMATHSSILAWEIPWTEEPGGLQSMGSQKSRTRLSEQTTTLTNSLLLFQPTVKVYITR